MADVADRMKHVNHNERKDKTNKKLVINTDLIGTLNKIEGAYSSLLLNLDITYNVKIKYKCDFRDTYMYYCILIC